MIDLHLHTTASDGRLSPAELIARAAEAGLETISITDHDTVAAVSEATGLASERGMRVVPGMEITAVHEGRDVHVLAYFFDPDHEPLLAFLEEQRRLRVARVRQIAARLAELGVPLGVDRLLALVASRPGTSVGRPQIARALVAAGHASSMEDAFDRFLSAGQPAFVPRAGPGPAQVIDVVHDAGGVASLAHPGVTARDELIAPLTARGLDAIEVFHSDHSPEDERKYRQLAGVLGVAMSGGSDFHGESPAGAASPRKRRATLGVVHLPPEHFEALEQRARLRAPDSLEPPVWPPV